MNQMSELYIRQAEIADAQSVVCFLDQIDNESDYVVFDKISVEAERQLIAHYLGENLHLMLVAELEGQIVGLGNLIAGTNAGQQHTAELGVCVLQKYWGMGIGSHLVEALLEYADEVGIDALTLEVVKENTRAIQLYKKFNFVACGCFHQRLRTQNSTYHCILMERVV